MSWDLIDLRALERLRAQFIAGTAGNQDYWRSDQYLESYDATFARRIGWKWDYVLRELDRRRWAPPDGNVVDWGCGTGIAGRALLAHCGERFMNTLYLWDRSLLAMQFAGKKIRELFPATKLWTELPDQSDIATLLVSHVLTEVTDAQRDELLALAARATAIIWVEPGTHAVSRKLIEIRERLRDKFHVIAPCTHQGACGLLAPGNERHWCHHFAPSPPEVFMDRHWAHFAKVTGIDVRSLPLSFLVLDKRAQAPLPSGAARIIGRPRIYKAHATVLGCDATGVRERRLLKRVLPEGFRRLKKGDVDPLQVWQSAGDEIVSAQPLD